jgi:RNA polymerase sigma-70 factor, ECF subfamily
MAGGYSPAVPAAGLLHYSGGMSADTGPEPHAAPTGFEATILPHVDSVFRFAMWLTRDRTESEDIVQDTLTQALQSFHRFQPGTNARAWLLTILRHVRSNRLRARQRRPEVMEGDDRLDALPAVEVTPQQVTDEDVLSALKALPPGFQEVIVLADVEELSYKEIAVVLEIPIGTVMSRIHRARRLLRGALAEYAAGQGIGRSRQALRGMPSEEGAS